MTHHVLSVTNNTIEYNGVAFERPEFADKEAVILVDLEMVGEYTVYERVLRDGAETHSYKWLCNLKPVEPPKAIIGTKKCRHTRRIGKGGRVHINGFMLQHDALQNYVGEACTFEIELTVYCDRPLRAEGADLVIERA